MNLEHPTKIVQLAAAVAAILVAIVGVFSFYQSQISAEGVCDSLRNKLIGVIDRNVPADVKFALMHRDAETFERKRAGIDPDSHTVFRVVIGHLHLSIHQENEPVQPSGAQVRKAAAQTAVAASLTAATPHAPPVVIFGLPTSGERRGWVAPAATPATRARPTSTAMATGRPKRRPLVRG